MSENVAVTSLLMSFQTEKYDVNSVLRAKINSGFFLIVCRNIY